MAVPAQKHELSRCIVVELAAGAATTRRPPSRVTRCAL